MNTETLKTLVPECLASHVTMTVEPGGPGTIGQTNRKIEEQQTPSGHALRKLQSTVCQ